MVGHIVMWKLQEGKDKEQAYADIKPALEGLVGVVPGLLEACVHKNFAGYDLCLTSKVESREALAVYQTHPAHLKVKAIVHSYMGERAAADFEI